MSAAVKYCLIPCHFRCPVPRNLLQQKAGSARMVSEQFGGRNWTSLFLTNAVWLIALFTKYFQNIFTKWCVREQSTPSMCHVRGLYLPGFESRQTPPGLLCHLSSNTISPESEPAPGFPAVLSCSCCSYTSALQLSPKPWCLLGVCLFLWSWAGKFWASPTLTVLLGLGTYSLSPRCVEIHFAHVISSGLTLPSIPSKMSQSSSSQAPFIPHHCINEKPQNTSLVRYEMVCKAKVEVTNTLFLTEWGFQ